MKFPYFWDLISVLLAKEIKLRYRGTVLGFLWSLANPLAFTVVLYVAFKKVLRVEIENYPLFILSALFPWQWLSNSINAAPMLFVSNASLIKRLAFPKVALGAAVVLNDMSHFCVTLPIFALLVLISSSPPPAIAWLAGIPILLTAQASLMLAIVIVVATLNAFFRDLEQLVRVLLLLLFYVTPVLYPASMVPSHLEWLLIINPLSPLIISWRTLLLDNSLSPYIFLAVVHAILALGIASVVYKRTQWRLAEFV